MRDLTSDAEIISNARLRMIPPVMGELVGIAHFVTAGEGSFGLADAEQAFAAMPKILDFIDGDVTRRDIRKYVAAVMRHLLPIVENGLEE